MKQPNDLNNKYRVLLTEVLPYELPLVLNNEAFYENMQDDVLHNLFISVFSKCMKKMDWTIPFDYNVRRVGGEKSRKLSLIHPLTQLGSVDHYEKYDPIAFIQELRGNISVGDIKSTGTTKVFRDGKEAKALHHTAILYEK